MNSRIGTVLAYTIVAALVYFVYKQQESINSMQQTLDELVHALNKDKETPNYLIQTTQADSDTDDDTSIHTPVVANPSFLDGVRRWWYTPIKYFRRKRWYPVYPPDRFWSRNPRRSRYNRNRDREEARQSAERAARASEKSAQAAAAAAASASQLVKKRVQSPHPHSTVARGAKTVPAVPTPSPSQPLPDISTEDVNTIVTSPSQIPPETQNAVTPSGVESNPITDEISMSGSGGDGSSGPTTGYTGSYSPIKRQHSYLEGSSDALYDGYNPEESILAHKAGIQMFPFASPDYGNSFSFPLFQPEFGVSEGHSLGRDNDEYVTNTGDRSPVYLD